MEEISLGLYGYEGRGGGIRVVERVVSGCGLVIRSCWKDDKRFWKWIGGLLKVVH